MSNLETINAQLSYPLLIGGLALMAIGFLWLLVRLVRSGDPLRKRLRKPLLLMAIGLCLAAAPPIIGKLVPIDLGPHEQMVDGERHLTLTGWDRKDYDVLRQKTDTARLQMANADVTDATVALLADYSKLKYLDVSNSQVDDQGLETVSRLTTLDTLYLNNTKVTAAGVEKHLTNHPALKVIWLRGTGITKDTADKVKAGLPGRRVFVD